MWGAARILALLRHERTIREALEQARAQVPMISFGAAAAVACPERRGT